MGRTAGCANMTTRVQVPPWNLKLSLKLVFWPPLHPHIIHTHTKQTKLGYDLSSVPPYYQPGCSHFVTAWAWMNMSQTVMLWCRPKTYSIQYIQNLNSKWWEENTLWGFFFLSNKRHESFPSNSSSWSSQSPAYIHIFLIHKVMVIKASHFFLNWLLQCLSFSQSLS